MKRLTFAQSGSAATEIKQAAVPCSALILPPTADRGVDRTAGWQLLLVGAYQEPTSNRSYITYALPYRNPFVFGPYPGTVHVAISCVRGTAIYPGS